MQQFNSKSLPVETLVLCLLAEKLGGKWKKTINLFNMFELEWQLWQSGFFFFFFSPFLSQQMENIDSR